MSGHRFDPTILREYDIRGTVGKTLHAADAEAIGRAFGTIVRRKGGKRVSVGYDGRLSSPDLQEALCRGLTAAGIDVLRIGLGPTPMLYFSVYHLETDGGIQITGSHNPPDYNGFKIMLGHGSFFGEDIQELGRIAAAADYESGEGSIEDIDLRQVYAERLLEGYSHASPLKVVWDSGNGAAGDVLRMVVAKLPGEHILLNADIDGTFPNHHPDPTVEENLEQLKDAVAASGADLGIGFDGDGDRIGVIDGQGRVLWGDQLIALLSREVLAERPGATIIADVKASQVLFDEIARLGGRPLMYKTGHSLIKTRMAEEKAPLAGEMSGHIFFADRYYGFDDALYVALRFLSLASAEGGQVARLRSELPEVINTPEIRFDCEESRKFAIVEEVRRRLQAEGADINDIDGVRVQTEDGWWLLRASNTQAVLVARCEASSAQGLERLKQALAGHLRSCGVAVPQL